MFSQALPSSTFSDLNFYLLLVSCVSNSKHFVGWGGRLCYSSLIKTNGLFFCAQEKGYFKISLYLSPSTVLHCFQEIVSLFFTKPFQGDCNSIHFTSSSLSIKICSFPCAAVICIDSIKWFSLFSS